jgi:hypothetical protein
MQSQRHRVSQEALNLTGDNLVRVVRAVFSTLSPAVLLLFRMSCIQPLPE